MSFAFHQYRLHGFSLGSELPFPELAPEVGHGLPEVVVRRGAAPETLGPVHRRGMCFEARPGEFLISKPGTARYFVRDGREVVIDAAPDADPAEVRRLFLAAPLAALLLQRGLLALQAAAVSTPAGAIVILAGACIGKSTLALECIRRGFTFVSDDIAAIGADATGRAAIFPGFPRLKLWPDVLPRFDLEPDRLPRVRAELEKRWVPCENSFAARPQPVCRIYALQRGEAPPGTGLVFPITGAERGLVLMNHLYFPGFMAGLGVGATVMRHVAALARDIPISRLTQPGGRSTPDEVAAAIERDLAS